MEKRKMTEEVKNAIERLVQWGAAADLAHTGHTGFGSAERAYNVLKDAVGDGDRWYLSDADYPDDAASGEELADFLVRAESYNTELIEKLVADARAAFEATR